MVLSDRESIDAAELICKTLLPHKKERTQILQFLSKSMFAIPVPWNSDRWGLTLFSNLIRLNVGPIEVLTISKNEVGIVLLESEMEDSLRVQLENCQGRSYHHPTGSRYFGIRVRQFCALAKELRSAHTTLIETASSRSRRPMYYKAHSRGLTAYLARELNTDACDPAPTPNDQKIEDLSFLEGQKYESILVRHHRSRFLRELFIRTHGCKCEACEFDFESTYGLSAQAI
jgi:hypothetical protein